MNARATWKGSLSVSLLSLRVKAYTSAAPEQEAIQLHQLHQACQCRIRYKKVCPRHGTVENDQIVMGYEHAPDRHVVIDLGEMDRLRSAHQLRAIRIDTFVERTAITPLYYGEKHYYLLPDGPTAQLPYALLVRAMLARRAEAVARVVLSKREQLVLVRPLAEKLLVMTCLKYDAQVRTPEAFADHLAGQPPLAKEELALAETLVKKRTARDFDLARYKDEYAGKLAQLVEAKLSGHELTPAREDEPRQILSLMDALKQSVAQGDRAVAKEQGAAKRPSAAKKPRAPERRRKTGPGSAASSKPRVAPRRPRKKSA